MPHLRLDNGERIYYEDRGPRDGGVVLMVHGWCASCRLFSEQMDALSSAGYRVVALDSAGHGRSSKYIAEFSFDNLMLRLEEFLDRLGLLDKPMAVMGHSAGGGVAQFLYFRHPDTVRALVLLQTGVRMRDSLPRYLFWSYGPVYALMFFDPAVKALLTPSLLFLADAFALAIGKKRSLAREWFRDIMRTPADVAFKEIREILRMDIEYLLPHIETPTCIIGSRFDPLVSPRQSVLMYKKMPNAELHILNLSGHIGKITEAARTNAIVLRFLKKNFPPQAPAEAAEKKKSPSRKTGAKKRKTTSAKKAGKKATA